MKKLYLIMTTIQLLVAAEFSDLLPKSEYPESCENVVKNHTIIFNGDDLYMKGLKQLDDKLFLSIYSMDWKDEGLEVRIVSFDRQTKEVKTNLLLASDKNDEKAKHLAGFIVDDRSLFFSTYAVDHKVTINGTRAYEYSLLSRKDDRGIQSEVFDRLVTHEIQLDSKYLYLNVSDRHKMPFTYKIIKVLKDDLSKHEIIYHGSGLVRSYAVTDKEFFVLTSKSKLLIHDKETFKLKQSVDLSINGIVPYYILIAGKRLYLGYAKHFNNYSWADIGYVDLDSLNAPVKLLNYNFKNIFDSIAVVGSEIYVLFKSGCFIKIKGTG